MFSYLAHLSEITRVFIFFFQMIRHPPRSTLFPSTPLSRSTRPKPSTPLPWVGAAMPLPGFLLAACVAHPPPRPVQRVYNEAPPPPPSPDVYAYPLHGQT